MSRERTLALACLAALLVAAAGWFVVRSNPPAVAGLEPLAAGVGSEAADSKPVLAGAAPDSQAPATSRDEALDGSEILGLDELEASGSDGKSKARGQEPPVTRVAGRVIDEREEPVVGARVLISSADTLPGAALDARANAGLVRETLTDGGGRFRVANVDSALARLAIRGATIAPFDLPDFPLPPGEVTDVGDLRMTAGVVLAGRVLDPTRRPIAGAMLDRTSTPMLGPVELLGGNASVALGMTDDEGRFRLEAQQPGRIELIVRAVGYRDRTFDLDASRPSAALASLELVLEPGASIAGKVLDHDPVSMGELEVVAAPQRDLELLETSRPPGADSSWLAGMRAGLVDAEGRFAVTGLQPDRLYTLRAARAGSARALDLERADAWAPVTTAPAGARDVVLAYGPGATIRFDAIDRFTGAPVEHLGVQIWGAWNAEFSDPARSIDRPGVLAGMTVSPLSLVGLFGAPSGRAHWPGGKVSIADLRAHQSRGSGESGSAARGDALSSLTIHAPGYDDKVLHDLLLSSGRTLDLGTVVLDPLPIFLMRAVDAVDDSPIAGATVLLTPHVASFGEGRTISEGRTNARGLGRLTALPSPNAWVSVARAGFAPTKVIAPMPTVVGASSPTPFDVRLPREAIVVVEVRDATGAPAPGVDLALTPPERENVLNWARAARTDAAGMACFRELPADVYELSWFQRLAMLPVRGGMPGVREARNVVCLSGAEVRVELEVPALAELSGFVSIGGKPLVAARVVFDHEGWWREAPLTQQESFELLPSRITDARGAFGPLEIEPGNYTLLITQEELGVRTIRDLRVEPGSNEFVVDVDDTAIRGRVTDARREPLAGVLVEAFLEPRDTGFPAQQDREPPVAPFLVPQVPRQLAVASAFTDSKGRYRLGCIPPGLDLELRFSLGRCIASVSEVEVAMGKTREHVNATIPDAGALAVRVQAPPTRAGTDYGVQVVRSEPPGGFGAFGAPLDRDGRAEFEELSPGRWSVTVVVIQECGLVLERREPEVVEVRPGERTESRITW